jgi:enoyl-CoA hydratase
MPAGTSTVRHERLGRVLVVRIEREVKRNAIDRVTAQGIDAALNLLADDDLWAGVITGTTAVFCVGTDLRDGTGGPTERGGEYGMIRRISGVASGSRRRGGWSRR